MLEVLSLTVQRPRRAVFLGCPPSDTSSSSSPFLGLGRGLSSRFARVLRARRQSVGSRRVGRSSWSCCFASTRVAQANGNSSEASVSSRSAPINLYHYRSGSWLCPKIAMNRRRARRKSFAESERTKSRYTTRVTRQVNNTLHAFFVRPRANPTSIGPNKSHAIWLNGGDPDSNRAPGRSLMSCCPGLALVRLHSMHSRPSL